MIALPGETVSLLAFAYVIGLVMLMTAGIYDGPLAEPSLLLVVACFAVLCVLGARLLLGRPRVVVGARPWLALLPIALAVYAVAVFADARLLVHGERPPRLIHAIELVQIGLLATYVPAAVRGRHEAPPWAGLRFACFASLFVAGGISVLYLSPHPDVDVWQLQTEAAKALLRGQNPYELSNVHVPEQAVDGLPPMAFMYPPTPCYVNAIAYALGRDVRWGLLAALLVTGIAMRQLARARGSGSQHVFPALVEDAPALLLWMTPKVYFFLESAWNDAYPLAFVTLALLAHARRRRYASAFFLGLTWSAKQSMIWLLPLGTLLGFSLGQWALALGTAAATMVPFALWDFHALKYWTFDKFFGYGPRWSALSPMNWLTRHFGISQGKAPPGILLAALWSLAGAWRAPRTRYAFAVVAALSCFSFYLFNRFTWMNYYFFVAGVASLAAAASLAEPFQPRATGDVEGNGELSVRSPPALEVDHEP
ncbi:MAG: hypothetical protein M3O36_12910 [Myxococcota bacterium]|nr:hypothetical protein [Myxococcota bacterium]